MATFYDSELTFTRSALTSPCSSAFFDGSSAFLFSGALSWIGIDNFSSSSATCVDSAPFFLAHRLLFLDLRRLSPMGSNGSISGIHFGLFESLLVTEIESESVS